ncbi:LOW QUALITY PROTEIN: uncharacterized protein LOC119991482 [Tripterygium wilfordii]|uniref:LOW QUALITY PROTEIN: uncharacterized protein LOC119991482 n=1 Tax=Tripterygium wilfordii TaxID=458696 RepID=UPI0018F863C6|nr:LOW QUALITY PROTEIN: uncharacterized protein LOC119991482 [Tripterygium wilfordii]
MCSPFVPQILSGRSSKVRALSTFYLLHSTSCTSENKDAGNGRIYWSLPGLAISQDGALLDVASERECDSSFIANPQAVYHGNGDLRMYCHSFNAVNGHFGIGIVRSRDGIKRLKLGKIIGACRSRGFDAFGATDAYMVRDSKDGKHLMGYEGVAADDSRDSQVTDKVNHMTFLTIVIPP